MTQEIILHGTKVAPNQVWQCANDSFEVITEIKSNYCNFPIHTFRKNYTKKGYFDGLGDSGFDLVKFICDLTPYLDNSAQLPETTTPISDDVKTIADSDGWIEHYGSECPVHSETMVEVEFEKGKIKFPQAAKWWNWKAVKKYRIIKEHVEPETPQRRLMLSASDMVSLVLQCSRWEWDEIDTDAITVALRIISEIEASPELIERIK